jgi:hypothetical protein
MGSDAKRRHQLLKFIATSVYRLPPWARLFITSRPEDDIREILNAFKPRLIPVDHPGHIEDLRSNIRFRLTNKLLHPSELDVAVEILFEKSQKRFVYVAKVAERNFIGDRTDWTLQSLRDDLPNGLDELYSQNMQRCIDADPSFFGNYLLNLLLLLVSTLEPLSINLAAKLLDIPDALRNRPGRLLSSLFGLRDVGIDKCFIPFHKSVLDWLMDPEKNPQHYADPKKGHQLFVDKFSRFFVRTKGLAWEWPPEPYFFAHLLDHLDLAGRSEEAKDLLTSLPWLMKTVEVRGANELIKDLAKRSTDSTLRIVKKAVTLAYGYLHVRALYLP